MGFGVISAPRPYVGADNELMVIPVIEASWGYFALLGLVYQF